MLCTTPAKKLQGSKKLGKEESGQELTEEKKGLLQPLTTENTQAMYSEQLTSKNMESSLLLTRNESEFQVLFKGSVLLF